MSPSATSSQRPQSFSPSATSTGDCLPSRPVTPSHDPSPVLRRRRSALKSPTTTSAPLDACQSPTRPPQLARTPVQPVTTYSFDNSPSRTQSRLTGSWRVRSASSMSDLRQSYYSHNEPETVPEAQQQLASNLTTRRPMSALGQLPAHQSVSQKGKQKLKHLASHSSSFPSSPNLIALATLDSPRPPRSRTALPDSITQFQHQNSGLNPSKSLNHLQRGFGTPSRLSPPPPPRPIKSPNRILLPDSEFERSTRYSLSDIYSQSQQYAGCSKSESLPGATWYTIPHATSPLQKLINHSHHAENQLKSALPSLLPSSDSTSTLGKSMPNWDSSRATHRETDDKTPKGDRKRYATVGPTSFFHETNLSIFPTKLFTPRRKSISSPPCTRRPGSLANLVNQKLINRKSTHGYQPFVYDLDAESSTKHRKKDTHSDEDCEEDFTSADEGDEGFWKISKPINPRWHQEHQRTLSASDSNTDQHDRWVEFEHNGHESLDHYQAPAVASSANLNRACSSSCRKTSHRLSRSVEVPPGFLSRASSRSGAAYVSAECLTPTEHRSTPSIYQLDQPFFSSSVLEEADEAGIGESLRMMAAHSEQLLDRLASGRRASLMSSPSKTDLSVGLGPVNFSPDFERSLSRSSCGASSPLDKQDAKFNSCQSRKAGCTKPTKTLTSSASMINCALKSISSHEKLGSSKVGRLHQSRKSLSMTFNIRQLPKLLSRSRDSSVDEDYNSSTRDKIIRVPSRSNFDTIPPVPEIPTHIIAASPTTWRGSLTSVDQYETLEAQYGRTEMRRQEVIWELIQTESSFVEGMRTVIKIFSRPLRSSRGTWVSGVPSLVGKLFDSLEEIIGVHSEISEMLESHRSEDIETERPLIIRFSDLFVRYVSKLEVYQAYLIRFEVVNKMIEEIISHSRSDFAEFIRLQSTSKECGKMNLCSFLLKPVQRLMKYPLFFKQLRDLTPSPHTDHASTRELLEATEAIIQVMQEVKGREDEYEALKVLERRISGLPQGFRLAVRDRRLLNQGFMKRVQLSSKSRAEAEQEAPKRLESHGLVPLSLSFSFSRQSSSPSFAIQRPLSQISDYSDLSSRSGKSSINNSDCSNSSFWNTPNPSSSDDSGIIFQPRSGETSSPEFGSNTASTRTSCTAITSESVVPSKIGRARQRTLSAGRLLRRVKDSQIYVFAFSDIIILTHKPSEGIRRIGRGKEQGAEYVAFDHIGLSRLFQVSICPGDGDHENLIKLKLIPSVPDGTGGLQASVGRPHTIFVSTIDHHSKNKEQTNNSQKERNRWLISFESSLTTHSSIPIRTFSRSPSFNDFNISSKEEKIWWRERYRIVKSLMKPNPNLQNQHENVQIHSNKSNRNNNCLDINNQIKQPRVKFS